MINHAIREWGINIQQNPVSMVSLPRMPQGRDRRLEAGEEEQLPSSTGELKRIIIVALETGMRRGEILGIKKSHIDFARQTLLIPITKTDTPRLLLIVKGHRGALCTVWLEVDAQDKTLLHHHPKAIGDFLKPPRLMNDRREIF